MKHLPLNTKLFVENRKRFIKEMKPNSIAIFNSNDEVPTSADATYRFQQNTGLYWLCGIEQEDTMVILFPGNVEEKYREVLVLVRPDELKEKWDGKRLRANEAR
jgi:Xaa-Pro aminopeptidase